MNTSGGCPKSLSRPCLLLLLVVHDEGGLLLLLLLLHHYLLCHCLHCHCHQLLLGILLWPLCLLSLWSPHMSVILTWDLAVCIAQACVSSKYLSSSSLIWSSSTNDLVVCDIL